MKIAVLSRNPNLYSTRRLVEAGVSRGHEVVVVDTLVPGTAPTSARPGTVAGLAWRMRMLERDVQKTELTRRGISVVGWRGPGTLDELLARMRRQPIRTVRR